MLFNSWKYFLLLSITFTIYWSVKNLKVRQVALFISCLVFYTTWNPFLVWLLLGTVLIHWLGSLYLKSSRKKQIISFLSFGSLSILAYYKYTNFFILNANIVFETFDLSYQLSKQSIILPLGISFYIFQVMAYSIDVYRGKIEPEKNSFILCLFIMFFPQLIAGPICRTTELLPQLKKIQDWKFENIIDALFLLLVGFFMKTSIADNLAPYINNIYLDPSQYSGYDNLLSAIGFGIQIYGDFCGYSLMALGSAKLFGYSLPFNFNIPYVSTTIQEFWRRWHITLSLWLKDYLYVPLGGNRKGKMMTYRNLTLTMVLGGLWHGANYTFLIWGCIHGFSLAIERFFLNRVNSLNIDFPKLPAKMIGYVWTMSIVFTAWIFFRADSVQLAMNQIFTIITPTQNWFQSRIGIDFYEIILIFVLSHNGLHYLTYNKPMSQRSVWLNCLMFPLILTLSIIYYADSEDFIYFQF